MKKIKKNLEERNSVGGIGEIPFYPIGTLLDGCENGELRQIKQLETRLQKKVHCTVNNHLQKPRNSPASVKFQDHILLPEV